MQSPLRGLPAQTHHRLDLSRVRHARRNGTRAVSGHIRLAAQAEHHREENATAFNLVDAKKYAETHKWKFASTYAKSAPHEYLVKKWLVEEDQLLYERFIATMKKYSVTGYFYGHKNNYLILGDHYYWFMPTPENMAIDLINRTTTDYLEFKNGAYYYKKPIR
jgi:hypothetical protein